VIGSRERECRLRYRRFPNGRRDGAPRLEKVLLEPLLPR